MNTPEDKIGQMTVGLDVSDKNVHACFLDHDGTVVEESRVAATPRALGRRFAAEEQYRIILEAGIRKAPTLPDFQGAGRNL